MNKIKLYWEIISPTLGIILTALIIFFSIGLLLSIPLCLLWNWLMPYIFGLPKLNILQTSGTHRVLGQQCAGIGDREVCRNS